MRWPQSDKVGAVRYGSVEREELMAYYSIGEVAERCGIAPLRCALATPLWFVEAATQRKGPSSV